MFVAVILTVILLFVNGAFIVMTNQLTTSFFIDIWTSILHYFNSFTAKLEDFLYAADKIHILSLTITLLIFVSLVFAILFILLKISSFVFKKNPLRILPSSPAEKFTPEEENALESELEAELTQKEDSSSLLENDSTPLEEMLDTKLETSLSQSQEEELEHQKSKSNDVPLIKLDWQKSRNNKPKADNLENQIKTPLNLRKNLRELLGMIVNMLGRNIDELKIAQALMYRCSDNLSEEFVLQLVLSIKEFLRLCQTNAFDSVRHLKELPTDEECILQLIAGDTSYAMALIEALMDQKINHGVSLKNSAQQTELFRQCSEYACYFGTLAEMNDLNLASAAFELGVELYPGNVTAWSRCADIYKQQGLEEKANQAYRNVLKISSKNKDERSEANACKFLSQFLYAQGESSQASELYLQSKNFYDSIGINRPLDRKELEIIELIDNTAAENIVHAALHQQQHQL